MMGSQLPLAFPLWLSFVAGLVLSVLGTVFLFTGSLTTFARECPFDYLFGHVDDGVHKYYMLWARSFHLLGLASSLAYVRPFASFIISIDRYRHVCLWIVRLTNQTSMYTESNVPECYSS